MEYILGWNWKLEKLEIFYGELWFGGFVKFFKEYYNLLFVFICLFRENWWCVGWVEVGGDWWFIKSCFYYLSFVVGESKLYGKEGERRLFWWRLVIVKEIVFLVIVVSIFV